MGMEGKEGERMRMEGNGWEWKGMEGLLNLSNQVPVV